MIRAARIFAEMTQEELARRSGVVQPNIAAYENGTRQPSATMLTRLLAAARPRPSAMLAEHRDEVLAAVSKHRASNVRVFGSVARGEDTAESDVDLLVTFHDDASMLDQSRIVIDLEKLLHCPVDVVSDEALGRRSASILDDAVPLS